MKWLECETKRLRQKKWEVFYSGVWEAGTFSKYFEQVPKALESQYIRLAISVTQTSGPWCSKEVSGLKHSTVEKIREFSGQWKKVTSKFSLQKEGKCMGLSSPILAARSGRHYLPSFSMEVAALEKSVGENGDGEIKFCAGRWEEGTRGCSYSVQSSVAARSFEPVSFSHIQYEKTRCTKCVVWLNVVWWSFEQDQCGK